MIILHTSDWHLGHHLHDHPRDWEHARFLAWLADQLDAHQVDALLICGDIYDHANPASASQRMLYQFLAEIHRRRPPHFRTLIVGGNHDSAIRLDAPIPLLDAMQVHVVGGLPRERDQLDFTRLIVPLADAQGQVRAWVGAMPYLRQSDLPGGDEEQGDFLIEGVRTRYNALFAELRARQQPGQALLATGHCYMVGGALSEHSERRILGGNQHALPAELFPEWLAYGALGHLHKAQRVAGREHLRYCGSPIPLSFAEHTYQHQVLLVRLEDERATEVTSLPVPRAVEMIRLGPLELDELEPRLRALPSLAELPADQRRPWLEVRVRVEQPQPGLHRRIEAALEGRAPVLVKSTQERIRGADDPANLALPLELAEWQPHELFERCYRKRYPGLMPPAYAQAFAELLAQVEEER